MSRSPTESLSQDEVFDILSNARRRYVLYYLREEKEPVSLDELARELAAWENDTTVEELTKQQRKRVYVSLYQTHIQKLAEAGIVDYDHDSGMIQLADRAAQIGAYLSTDGDESEGDRMRWQETYLLLAGISAVLYGLVAFDVLTVLSEAQIGVAIVVAFGALASIHYLYTRREEPEMPADALIRER